MKIALMMRAIDQDSGFRAYMINLLDALLRIDRENSYLLLYRTPREFGRYGAFANVRELLLSAPHKLLWDQVAVPYAAWKHGADIIYNPKFSIPLVAPCPVSMGLHEPAWWAWPEHYERLDVLYMRAFLPLYCRKASHFFPWSHFTVAENRKHLGLPFTDVTVTYAAPSPYFHPIDDRAALDAWRERHHLPERFVLVVTRVDHPGLDRSTSFYPGKNVETAARAFRLCRGRVPHQLVVAGRRVREYLVSRGWSEQNLEGIRFLGFVPHEELPMLYNLAELFVLPSYYESFAMTMVEAMACGCPVVGSRTGASAEISAGAALLADPRDPADFSENMLAALEDETVRRELRRKGLERAAWFSWDRTARLTLQGLTLAAAPSRRRRNAAGGVSERE